MKLKIQRETLLKPLQLVIGVVEKKQALPILANVLLSIKDNTLSITATDTEVELIGKTTLDEKVSCKLLITAAGRKLWDICRSLPDGSEVEVSLENQKIDLISGRSRFSLQTLPAENFPKVEQKEKHLEFTIPQRVLKKLLQHTHFAMAQQDVRYYLNGMLLETGPMKLTAVATDGHRLAANHAKVPAIASDHRIQVILPRKGVLELMRLLDDSEEEVQVVIGSNHLRVVHPSYIFTCKLVEGRFPDYQRVIPKVGNKVVVIERQLLKQALSRAAILCNEKFRGVRLSIKPGLLHISANNPEHEVAEEEVAIEYENESIEIGFNVTYLLDILNTVGAEKVRLSFADANSSVLVEEINGSHDGLYVVMPMRL